MKGAAIHSNIIFNCKYPCRFLDNVLKKTLKNNRKCTVQLYLNTKQITQNNIK